MTASSESWKEHQAEMRLVVARLINEHNVWADAGYPFGDPAYHVTSERLRDMSAADLRMLVHMLTGTAARCGAASSYEVTEPIRRASEQATP